MRISFVPLCNLTQCFSLVIGQGRRFKVGPATPLFTEHWKIDDDDDACLSPVKTTNDG